MLNETHVVKISVISIINYCVIIQSSGGELGNGFTNGERDFKENSLVI